LAKIQTYINKNVFPKQNSTNANINHKKDGSRIRPEQVEVEA